MIQEPFTIRRVYNAPVEKVWKAITSLEQMQQWYFSALKDFQPVPGFTTSFTITHNGKEFLHIWTVTELIPGKKIAYEWKYGGYPGNSLISFELFTEGGQTTLLLTHSGLETFNPAVYPELGKENFAKGWTSFIGNMLKQFVESPILEKP